VDRAVEASKQPACIEVKLRLVEQQPAARPRCVNVEKLAATPLVVRELLERIRSLRVTLNRNSEQPPPDSSFVGHGGDRQVWIVAQTKRRAELLGQPARSSEQGLRPKDELTTV
jgi:hypothetical protein